MRSLKAGVLGPEWSLSSSSASYKLCDFRSFDPCEPQLSFQYNGDNSNKALSIGLL